MTDPYRRQTPLRGRTGPTGPIGQPVQNPLGNMEMDAETALYVGTLEAQLAAYAINEVKYRVLLELLTGESWYSTRVTGDDMGRLLADLATDALIRRGMDGTEARTLVNRRLSASEEVEPTMPEPKDLGVEPVSIDIRERFAEWQSRNQGRVPLLRQQGPRPNVGSGNVSQDTISNEPQQNSSQEEVDRT